MLNFAGFLPGGNMPRQFARILATVFVVLLLSVALLPSASAQAASWVLLKPTNSPSARAAFAMAYDPISRKVVLFGGFDYNAYLNETWTFDGTTWKKVNTPVAPSGRAAAGMAFDYVAKKLVLFGGYNGRYLRDTWLWDGSTMQWAPGHALSAPPAVTGPAVFTDPKTKTVTTFGGFDGRFYQLQTWRWKNGTWNRLNPIDFPTARGAMVSAYDIARNNAVVFAGLADINPYNTWTWNGTDWTRQLPSEQPPYRYFGGATYDPHFDAVICFGGGLAGADLNDTWAWDGTDWSQMSPQGFVPARESFGIAYDEAIGKTVLFGGQLGGKLLRDTYVLQAQ
jgi:kelch motif-containing protein